MAQTRGTFKRVKRYDPGNISQTIGGVRQLAAPESISWSIAQTAVQLAKQYGAGRGWKATEALQPLWGKGWVGIHTPYKHLIYQEKGIQPFVMYQLEGKLVPIHDASGLHFVRATGVGQPGFVRINGETIWRDQKWRHPGIKPTHFMENSVKQAIQLHKNELQTNFLSSLLSDVQGMRQNRRGA